MGFVSGVVPHFVASGYRAASLAIYRSTLFFLETTIHTFYNMHWTAEERAHAVEVYHRCGSAQGALRALRREWGRELVPVRQTLVSWVRAFRRVGSVPGAPSRVRARRADPAVAEVVRRAIRRTPRLSVRRLSAKTGVSRSRVQRVLRQQLRLYPLSLIHI